MTQTLHPELARLFEPIRVGTMALKNRLMIPAHGAGVGNILGTEEEATSFRAYYVAWALALVL